MIKAELAKMVAFEAVTKKHQRFFDDLAEAVREASEKGKTNLAGYTFPTDNLSDILVIERYLKVLGYHYNEFTRMNGSKTFSIYW